MIDMTWSWYHLEGKPPFYDVPDVPECADPDWSPIVVRDFEIATCCQEMAEDNNLVKRSMCVNLKDPRGRELVLRLAPRFDVIAENSRAGAMAGSARAALTGLHWARWNNVTAITSTPPTTTAPARAVPVPTSTIKRSRHSVRRPAPWRAGAGALLQPHDHHRFRRLGIKRGGCGPGITGTRSPGSPRPSRHA